MYQTLFRTNSHVMYTEVALCVVAAQCFRLVNWMPVDCYHLHPSQLKAACPREVPQPN